MASSSSSRRLRSLANSISTNQHLFVLVVMITLLLGVGSWQSVRLSIQSDLYSRLENETDNLQSSLSSRMANYANTLADLRGYFLVNGIPTPEKFQKIFESVDFQNLHPGVEGIGFSYVQKNPEMRTPVSMIEPMTSPNQQSLGFNMMSEPHRAEAISRAIDSGEASLTSPLSLSQEAGDKQIGFILYMPIYATAVKPQTILGRRAQIRGLLYIPLRTENFFSVLLGAPVFAQERVNFSVSAQTQGAANEPFYERFNYQVKEARPLVLKRSLNLYGTRWDLDIRALPQFYRITDELLPTAIMLLALIISALIFVLFRVIQNQLMYEKKSKAEIQAAKNAFLANMSHEIRTPLGVVLGFADILARGESDPETQDDLVRGMRRNGEQLTRIIDDVLDLTKVEAGKFSIEKHSVHLPSVMHEIQSAMALRSSEKGIEFRIQSEGLLPSSIDTDEIRLKQILMNVVGNAIKFTEKGSVTLKVRFKREPGLGNQIVFEIEDTGIGIPPEARGELFQAFSQGDASNTRRFGGTGLGLALSRRLAEELGGTIHLVKSDKDHGSVFAITLKCGETEPVEWLENVMDLPNLKELERAAAMPPEIRLDGKRLLLVEDSEDNQDIFIYFLENAGAKVTLATNGFEAVKAIEENDYDAILMDIQIPGIDGKEAARRIRRQGYGKPIIALTAHAMLEERQSCLQAGCNGQITKPVDGTGLLSQLNGFLGS